MREIKFRGKRVHNGKWLYGLPTCSTSDNKLVTEFDVYRKFFLVETETIGQYTGLKDKNGKEIYDGDICKDGNSIIQIVWSDHHQWACKIIKGCVLSTGLTFPLWQWDKCEQNGYRELEVISNIYDNPELLEVSEC